MPQEVGVDTLCLYGAGPLEATEDTVRRQEVSPSVILVKVVQLVV